MIFRDYFPTPQLREYIEVYHLRHFVFSNNVKPPFKPYPPRPEQCMTFYARGMEISEHVDGNKIEKPRSVLSGQFTYRINRYSSYPEFLMILVVFKPGALHRLTGIPFNELTNADIDAEAVFSSELHQVNSRLTSTDSYPEMIAIIELFFYTLAIKNKKEAQPVDNIFDLLVKNDSNYKLDWLAKNAYLSPRQLERKFYERIGVCPKTFLRISRFSQSYWLRLKKPDLDWFSIAISCGYNDYQHMVRDYKEFASTTPNLLFNDENKAPERVLGLNK